MFGMEADRFTGRKILIAGVMGALGPALAHQLVRRGAEVIATDRGAASLAGLAARLDGAVQVRAVDPAQIAQWIRAAHQDLAGLILADPRDGAANAALARDLAPLLARNPDPFLAMLGLGSDGPAFRSHPGLQLTLGILQAPPTAQDAPGHASRLLAAIGAGRTQVRLGRAGMLARFLPSGTAPQARRADAY